MKEFSAFIRGVYLYLDLCIALYVLGLKELPVNLRDSVLAENNLDVSVF